MEKLLRDSGDVRHNFAGLGANVCRTCGFGCGCGFGFRFRLGLGGGLLGLGLRGGLFLRRLLGLGLRSNGSLLGLGLRRVGNQPVILAPLAMLGGGGRRIDALGGSLFDDLGALGWGAGDRGLLVTDLPNAGGQRSGLRPRDAVGNILRNNGRRSGIRLSCVSFGCLVHFMSPVKIEKCSTSAQQYYRTPVERSRLQGSDFRCLVLAILGRRGCFVDPFAFASGNDSLTDRLPIRGCRYVRARGEHAIGDDPNSSSS